MNIYQHVRSKIKPNLVQGCFPVYLLPSSLRYQYEYEASIIHRILMIGDTEMSKNV